MAVRPADAERADARHPRPIVVGPVAEPVLDPQVPLRHGNSGIGFGVVQARRDSAVLERQHRLDHPEDTGRALEMPDIGLDRADPQRCRRGTSGAEHPRERGRLDRVPDSRSGTVQFDVTDPIRCYARARVGRPQHLGLPVDARRGQAEGGPVVVDRAAPDHGANRVAVAYRRRQRLQHDDAAALPPHEPVGAGIEGVAPAAGRQRAEPLQRQPGLGEQVQVHTARDRVVAAARPQALARQLHGDQRRRLRGIDGQARPAQTEGIRHPVRDQPATGAGECVRPDRGVAEPRQNRREVTARGADENPGPPAPQTIRHDARRLEGLPAQFQGQALLRVGRRGLARRHPEEVRVELRGVGQVGPAAQAGRQRRGAGPAIGRCVAEGVAAVHQQPPELLRRPGARHPARHTDHGDVVAVGHRRRGSSGLHRLALPGS